MTARKVEVGNIYQQVRIIDPDSTAFFFWRNLRFLLGICCRRAKKGTRVPNSFTKETNDKVMKLIDASAINS